jgi:hypothetical protein
MTTLVRTHWNLVKYWLRYDGENFWIILFFAESDITITRWLIKIGVYAIPIPFAMWIMKLNNWDEYTNADFTIKGYTDLASQYAGYMYLWIINKLIVDYINWEPSSEQTEIK